MNIIKIKFIFEASMPHGYFILRALDSSLLNLWIFIVGVYKIENKNVKNLIKE